MNSSIKGLFIKVRKGQPMQAVPSFVLKKGHGIIGDVNANGISPRQILVTRLEEIDEFKIDAGAIRENITTKGIPLPLFQPGNVLSIGEAKIRLTFHCEPCKRIAHLVKPSQIMGKRGLLGVILNGGEINMEQPVNVSEKQYPPMSEKPYDRFLDFVQEIPKGKVITYREVTIGMGVADSYMRAVPTYIKKTPEKYPVHRIVDTNGNLVENYVPYQRQLLESENIEIHEERDLFSHSVEIKVNLRKYLWMRGKLYQ